MAILATAQPVVLSAATPRVRVPATGLIPIQAQTASLTVRVQLPTTPAPLAWASSAKVRVTVVLVVDGRESRCTGEVSGGIHLVDGVEQPEYRLTFIPAVQPTLTRDGVTIRVGTRLGERGTAVGAYFLLDRVRGSIATELLEASTSEAPPPVEEVHNSVAWDTISSVVEASGDGVVSVAHDPIGTSNLGAFAGVINGFTSAQASTSATYGGTAMLEKWDVGGSIRSAGYTWDSAVQGALPSTSQTVTSTLAGAPNSHILLVATFTGVDQTTPVGTAVSTSGAGTSASVTVTGLDADGLIIEATGFDTQGTSPVIGADQTERLAPTTDQNTRAMASTQPGSVAGGVMSWSWTSTANFAIGAIQFLPAAGGASAMLKMMLANEGG